MEIKTDVDNKKCLECGDMKDLADFGTSGKRQPCKVCRALWYQAHRLEQVARNHNGKARRLGLPGTLTPSDLAAVLDEQGAACLVCSATEHLHFDHVISYYCKGENTRENLQILCASHNSAKGRACLDYRS